MADFKAAFEIMIHNEGGYRLHTVQGDRGGQTYAGIARKYHPYWPGWRIIDTTGTNNAELTKMVREFYKVNFWYRINGDLIESQAVASTIFDFAVNAGPQVAAKLAQIVVGATPDGAIGPKTLAELNKAPDGSFSARYALAKVARYAKIVNRDRSQAKFLLGWINRTLKAVS